MHLKNKTYRTMKKKQLIEKINLMVEDDTAIDEITINGVYFDKIDKIGGMCFIYSYDHDIEVDVDENLTIGQLTTILESL